MTSDRRRASFGGIAGSRRDSRDSQTVAAAMTTPARQPSRAASTMRRGWLMPIMLPARGAAGASRAAQPDSESCCAIAS